MKVSYGLCFLSKGCLCNHGLREFRMRWGSRPQVTAKPGLFLVGVSANDVRPAWPMCKHARALLFRCVHSPEYAWATWLMPYVCRSTSKLPRSTQPQAARRNASEEPAHISGRHSASGLETLGPIVDAASKTLLRAFRSLTASQHTWIHALRNNLPTELQTSSPL